MWSNAVTTNVSTKFSFWCNGMKFHLMTKTMTEKWLWWVSNLEIRPKIGYFFSAFSKLYSSVINACKKTHGQSLVHDKHHWNMSNWMNPLNQSFCSSVCLCVPCYLSLTAFVAIILTCLRKIAQPSLMSMGTLKSLTSN